MINTLFPYKLTLSLLLQKLTYEDFKYLVHWHDPDDRQDIYCQFYMSKEQAARVVMKELNVEVPIGKTAVSVYEELHNFGNEIDFTDPANRNHLLANIHITRIKADIISEVFGELDENININTPLQNGVLNNLTITTFFKLAQVISEYLSQSKTPGAELFMHIKVMEQGSPEYEEIVQKVGPKDEDLGVNEVHMRMLQNIAMNPPKTLLFDFSDEVQRFIIKAGLTEVEQGKYLKLTEKAYKTFPNLKKWY